MSSPNVLQPTAPGYHEPLYPQLAPDFRLQKINEVSAALNNEVSHYRKVGKKYKNARKIVNWTATGTSFLSVAFLSASFGSAISVVGLPTLMEHQEIVTLAIAKRNTLNRIVSKALTDKQMSDAEFQLIMTEYSQYNVPREAVRAKC